MFTHILSVSDNHHTTTRGGNTHLDTQLMDREQAMVSLIYAHPLINTIWWRAKSSKPDFPKLEVTISHTHTNTTAQNYQRKCIPYALFFSNLHYFKWRLMQGYYFKQFREYDMRFCSQYSVSLAVWKKWILMKRWIIFCVSKL